MNKKKILMILLLLIFIALIIFAFFKIKEKSAEKNNINDKVQENRETSKDEIIEIKDEYFISATNDIYYNLDSYLGKTIKMQGLIYEYDLDGKKCYAVVRNSPGCCGNDGLAGLDIKYEGKYYPNNTWVEIIGVVDKITWQDGYSPIVNVTSMEEKEVGQTFVTN